MIELLLTVAILGIIGFLAFKYRKKLEVQSLFFPVIYFVMYRTRWGLRWMDRVGTKYSRFWSFVFTFGVVLGFVAMVLICVELINSTISLLLQPEAAPGVMPVLPVKVKGAVAVPFLYWVISIFVIAVVHEFAHGIASRHVGVRVKSSGLAALCLFIPVIPAAFVEPDEKRIPKIPVRQQLKVFAAGPLANIVTAFAVLLLVVAAGPAINSVLEPSGVEVDRLQPGSPAASVLEEGMVIESIAGSRLTTVDNFSQAMASLGAGETVKVATSRGEFQVELSESPQQPEKGYLGVYPKQVYSSSGWFPEAGVPLLQWILGLLSWLFFLNLGIGVFNLLPVGPLDGGHMISALCDKFNTPRVYKFVSIFFLAIVLMNVFVGFVR